MSSKIQIACNKPIYVSSGSVEKAKGRYRSLTCMNITRTQKLHAPDFHPNSVVLAIQFECDRPADNLEIEMAEDTLRLLHELLEEYLTAPTPADKARIAGALANDDAS